MSRKKPDPFDHTVIIPGVPELPMEATQILPINQFRPELELPRPEPRPFKIMRPARWALGAMVFAVGLTWWFLASSGSVAEPTMASFPREASASTRREASTSTPPAPLQGYLDAAKQGDPKAMRMLGASYTYGLGVRINKAEGIAWYRKAADAGDKTAAQELKAAGGD